jgi:hypothetical protein
MSAQDPATRRFIFLNHDPVTYRLLRELGHTVVPVPTADGALDAMQQETTDLLIVDLDDAAQANSVERLLAELPPDHQPRQVAMFSEKMDSHLSEMRRRISPARVHVFLKPLHLHGLLGLLKQIESDPQRATA